MQNKRHFTVAIIGLGSRGAEAYGRIMAEHGEWFTITALCDINPVKLQKYGAIFGTDELYATEEEFFAARRADVLVLATMDNDHVRQCERALELGYDVLLEKPITGSEEECERLLATHRKYGGKVIVCHVLRYAPAYRRVKELLDAKVCGELVMIDSIEQVCFWHQAHSFVRGNWRSSEISSPMILQKCCHDFDLLQFYVGAKCETLSSVGDLRYFRPECKPEGAADRCVDCKYRDSCPYSAVTIYIGYWKDLGCPENAWPYNAVTTAYPLTEEALTEAVTHGPYGRCVHSCDNDVVDHQIVMMKFANGVKANLRMTAFTASGGRLMRFYCTHGQIDLEESKLYVKRFNEPVETIDFEAGTEGGHVHGGGDGGLIREFYRALCEEENAPTLLEDSVESHLMAIRAEQSRLAGGIPLRVHPAEREETV